MSDTVYALYVCFKATRDFRDLDLDDAAQEVENLFKEWEPSVTVRGVYSTVGFRADTDLMLWFVGPTERRSVMAHAKDLSLIHI